MLEPYYSLFKKFSDTDRYAELEMDSDSLYLAWSEEKLEDVILPEKRSEWDQLRSKGCTDNFIANELDNFSPVLPVLPTDQVARDLMKGL